MDPSLLHFRSRVLHAIRAFFEGAGYLEVDTPLLAPGLIPESTIPAFKTRYEHPYRGGRDLYLVPSPELWMKRLLASGSGPIFQISHCFRNAESLGANHEPEFAMLEWYTPGHGYRDSLDVMTSLLTALAPLTEVTALKAPALTMTMEEAFRDYAGYELGRGSSLEALREEAARRGLPPMDDWEAAFHGLFLNEVEPKLPADRPLFLADYPAGVRCLARRIPGTPWRERWELYLKGIEIANCFTEETDPAEAAGLFEDERREIDRRGLDRPSDDAFLSIFDGSFPACSGVALGLDRLVMLLAGRSSIADVIPFPVSSFLDSSGA